MTVLVPESFFAGAFRVIRQIGAGGMGTVYEVEQLSTRKRRALKVLFNRVGGDDKARARFVREATVGADIRSEHCVDVIGAGFDQATGLPWLAMELLDGVDLRRLVDRGGPLGPAHALAVFRQIGHGLGAAHDVGVVHRDLKPENVFVARSRRSGQKFTVKLLDFGIAKITRETVGNSDTSTVGSPMWMAPEQINAGPLSARTDVWALGLLAFWALTGKVYWTAAYGARVTIQALFAEQLFAELVPASQRAASYHCGATLPDEFDDWFANCVHRSADERFADANAAVNALRTILEPGAAVDVRSDAPLLPAPGGGPSTGTQRPVAQQEAGAAGYEMAGTTGDVLGGQPGPASLVETAASEVGIGVESTDLHAGVVSSAQPTQFSGVSPGPGRASAAPGRATLAAAIAVPLVLMGAGAGALMYFSEEDRGAGSAAVDRLSSVDAAEGDGGMSRQGDPEPISTAGFEDKGPAPVREDKGGSGKVDLSALPTPKRLQFLGWTQGGTQFATRAAYGEKIPRSGRANYLELIHVHSADGTILESYVAERVDAAGLAASDALGSAAADALTSRQWLKRRVGLMLVSPDPRRQPRRRAGAFHLTIAAAPEQTRMRIQPNRTGFDVQWWGFADVADPAAASAARWRIEWDGAGERSDLVTEPIDLSYVALASLMERDEGTVVNGSVQVHWSADERRCVLLVDVEAKGADGETIAERRIFARKLP